MTRNRGCGGGLQKDHVCGDNSVEPARTVKTSPLEIVRCYVGLCRVRVHFISLGSFFFRPSLISRTVSLDVQKDHVCGDNSVEPARTVKTLNSMIPTVLVSAD